MHSAASICGIHIFVPICFSDNWLMCVDRPLKYLSKRQGNLHLFEKGGGDKGKEGNRNPIRDIFCFAGKYVVLWGLKGVSVAIRLFKASQWECGGARLSPLPCPPTGTDGHPRSSLISLQSGNDPCSWDVAALFKYDARCSPTFSMSSHCPRKPEGERERRERAQHPTTQHAMWDIVLIVLCLQFSFFPHLYFSFCLLSVAPNWEGGIAGDLRWPRPWKVMQFRFYELTQSSSSPQTYENAYADTYAYACSQAHTVQECVTHTDTDLFVSHSIVLSITSSVNFQCFCNSTA